MIIILNGTSSSGKSTISQELHHRLGDGWLYFSMDGYLSMLGAKYWGLHPDNQQVCTPNEICYAKKHDDGTFEIITGEYCSALYTTIPDVLVLMAKQGFNIIVDSFITTMNEFNFYKEKLGGYNPLFIYLYAPENIISAREKARGDRLPGSAIHWLKKFECTDACDLKINTAEKSVEEVAQLLMAIKPRHA